MNDQFLEFEGTTFANHGAVSSSTGGFGEIDFNGIGGTGGTTQTLSGAGTYSGSQSFPIEIQVINSTTVTLAGGSVVSGVFNFAIQALSTLSVPGTSVFANGAINNSGSISGAGTLQTQGAVALAFSGGTTPSLQVVNGTTMGNGNFKQVTINSSATLFLNGNATLNVT